jgi:diguanylate cyclase (GGDEF)-like protein
MDLTTEDLGTVLPLVNIYLNQYVSRLAFDLSAVLPGPNAVEIRDYADDIARLHTRLRGVATGPLTLDDAQASLLREIVIWQRRREASAVEELRKNTIHKDIHRQLDLRLAPLDSLMAKWWFRSGPRRAPPALSDYLPIQVLEANREAGTARVFDEKFGILQAPAQFVPDLEEARTRAESRNVTTAVAYIDIDKFKKVNSTHTESVVDREILPNFMRALEAHVFMRGMAYRFGGDEYVLLLHNTSRAEALASAQDLRLTIAALEYAIHKPLTISIGVAVVPPRCHLTSREIEQKANAAKNHAKGPGKRNRVATYKDPWFEELTLFPRTKKR